MPDLLSLLPSLPVTVAAAVAIFLAKELLEGGRRFFANRRKLKAIKTLVAAECERNAWTISHLVEALEKIEQIGKPFSRFRIDSNQSYERFVAVEPGGNDRFPLASVVLPRTHRSMIEKFLFEAASLDKRLFGRMVEVLDAMPEIDHVRTSLIDMVKVRDIHLDGFPEYGVAELRDAEDCLTALYERCTGKKTLEARVR